MLWRRKRIMYGIFKNCCLASTDIKSLLLFVFTLKFIKGVGDPGMSAYDIGNDTKFLPFYLLACLISILKNVILLVLDPEKLFRCSVVFISLRYDLSNFIARQFIIIFRL